MTYTLLRIACFAIGLVACQPFAFSQSEANSSQPGGFKFLLSGALEFGGESVADIQFTNGDTQKMNAGQGGTIAVGAAWHAPNTNNFLSGHQLGLNT